MRIKSTLKKCLVFITASATLLTSVSIVGAVETASFSNVTLRVGSIKKISFSNPYSKKYTLKIKNKKIAKQVGKINASGEKTICKIKGLKKGKTLVTVFDSGKKAGSFKITVLRAKAKIKNSCKNLTLKYNSHGSTAYMTDCHIYLKDMIKNAHPNGKYTVASDNYNIVSHTNSGHIYTVNKGKTTLTVYEKIGNGKTKVLGEVKVTVKNTKMAYVAKENKNFYPEGIFGNGNKYHCVYLNETKNIQGRIKKCLVNNKYTGSSFKKSEYKITYKSANSSVATVTKAGRVTGVKTGDTKIKYTITFSDGSVFSDYCHISVEAPVGVSNQ